MGEVGVGRIGVGGLAGEEVGAGGGGGERDVHVAAVAGEALAGLGHEAGGDAVLAAEGFDDVSGRGAQKGVGRRLLGGLYLKRLALSAIWRASQNSRAWLGD